MYCIKPYIRWTVLHKPGTNRLFISYFGPPSFDWTKCDEDFTSLRRVLEPLKVSLSDELHLPFYYPGSESKSSPQNLPIF